LRERRTPPRTTSQHDVGVDHPFDVQHDSAVGEVDVVTRCDPPRELGNRRGDAVRVADHCRRCQRELTTGLELDLVVDDGPGAHLRSGQVDEHADGASERGRRLARQGRALRVHIARAVRRVEAHHVGARGEQRAHRLRRRRGRADGRDDLRAAHAHGLSRD
jgi:hypothetical protein